MKTKRCSLLLFFLCNIFLAWSQDMLSGPPHKKAKEIFDMIKPKTKAEAASPEFAYKIHNVNNDTLQLKLGVIFDPLITDPKSGNLVFMDHPLKIEGCKLGSVLFDRVDTKYFYLEYSKVGTFGGTFMGTRECQLTNDSIDYLSINNNSQQTLRIKNSFIKDFNLTSPLDMDLDLYKVSCPNSFYMVGEFRSVYFYRCNILNFEALGIHVTKTFELSGCRFSNYCQMAGRIKQLELRSLFFDNDAILDIRNCFPDSAKKMVLSLDNIPVEHLRLNWKNITLSDEIKSDYDKAKSTYVELIENFKQHKQLENLEMVDKEYQSYCYKHFKFLGLGWIWDKIVWLWWDYGYGGWQVVLWMMMFPVFWALIIYRFYHRVYEKVYKLENYKPLKLSSRTRTEQKSFYRALLYVSIIFFTLNIKLDKLKYESRGLLLVFLLIYLNGIFCLFFLVNFLLKTS